MGGRSTYEDLKAGGGLGAAAIGAGAEACVTLRTSLRALALNVSLQMGHYAEYRTYRSVQRPPLGAECLTMPPAGGGAKLSSMPSSIVVSTRLLKR